MVRCCCCVAIAAAASAAIAGGNDIDRFGLSRERGSCNERVRTTFTTIAVKSTIDKGIVELLSSFLPTWLLLLFFFVDTVQRWNMHLTTLTSTRYILTRCKQIEDVATVLPTL